MATVAQLFDRAAQRYDQARRQLLPCFDDLYGAALDLLPDDRTQALRVLDLGAGTGLLAGLIAVAYPHAHLTLVDLSREMLAKAGERFSDMGRQAAIELMDLAQPDFRGPFDAIVSALAIHHLDDAGKRALFAHSYRALRPGGIFINVEQVLGATPAIERRYQQLWLRDVRERGVGAADLAAALERMAQDRCSPLADQMRWLAESGFQEVNCWYKNGRFAVYAGSK
ncbi:MAG TPA: methyltransferase domain-containing protein [Roseiflexaceae bacterium]|nr:methyltransferase domain-containing protein [Roseiflexaceae bacterium]